MTVSSDKWLLPAGVEELLPDQAWQIEALRRQLLDFLCGRGYDLVTPPLVEFLDSLLTGVGEDLDLQTFKVTDHISGRLLGVRADLTPQVARIDAHYLDNGGINRLCYLSPALNARLEGVTGTREQLQLGAELFGYAGVEADCEIINVMIDTLAICGLPKITLDIGHVGLYRALAKQAQLSAEVEALIFDALRRKSRPDLELVLNQQCAGKCDYFLDLLALKGERSVLDQARKRLKGLSETVTESLNNLQQVVDHLTTTRPELSLYIDLAELRGYRYHTGVVFSAYSDHHGKPLASGGRYDAIGSAFGTPRPATGFSGDLRRLIASAASSTACKPGIAAPASEDTLLLAEIARLRQQGERVIQCLPGQQPQDLSRQCDRQLVNNKKQWQIKSF